MTIPVTTAVDYSIPASPETVARTVDAIRARGIKVILVETSAEALAKIHEIIPAGATIMMGMSQTLQEIGLEAQLINKQHPWVYLKDEIMAEQDPTRRMELGYRWRMAGIGQRESGQIAKAAKAEVRVLAGWSPFHQAAKRDRFMAIAVRTCCKWVWPGRCSECDAVRRPGRPESECLQYQPVGDRGP